MGVVRAHPFWKSCTGSSLVFCMIKPPESYIHSLHVTTVSVPKPDVFEVYIRLSDGQCGAPQHLTRAQAIKFIKREWMRYYYKRTRIEFIEHQHIDLQEMVSDLMGDDDVYSTSEDSGSATPSPRSLFGWSPRHSPLNSPRRASDRPNSPRDLLYRRLGSPPNTRRASCHARVNHPEEPVAPPATPE